MSESTNPEEAHRLNSGAHSQGMDEDLAWLTSADVEVARRAEQLARLEGDRALVNDLVESNFEGKKYVRFANELAKYGLAVIRGWIRRDLILAKVATRGFGQLEAPLLRERLIDDADDLANETVVRALIVFRDKVLIPGVWDPRKGASLRTFFIGQCLKQFPNVYRSWHADQVRNFAEYSGLNVFEEGPATRRPPEPGEALEKQEEIRTLFGCVSDERVKNAFYLNAIHGFSYAEVATKLDMTEKAVESAIGRARRAIREGQDTA